MTRLIMYLWNLLNVLLQCSINFEYPWFISLSLLRKLLKRKYCIVSHFFLVQKRQQLCKNGYIAVLGVPLYQFLVCLAICGNRFLVQKKIHAKNLVCATNERFHIVFAFQLIRKHLCMLLHCKKWSNKFHL
jgi:hypothetical protein